MIHTGRVYFEQSADGARRREEFLERLSGNLLGIYGDPVFEGAEVYLFDKGIATVSQNQGKIKLHSLSQKGLETLAKELDVELADHL